MAASSLTNGPGQLGYNTNATGWSVPSPNGSYAFVFAAGTADVGGSNGEYGGVSLWGPNNGSANGLPATSPDGGNFVALDSAFQVGALSQTISGLTPGDTYAVSFYWAGAQQYGFTGPTIDNLTVSLGSSSMTTNTVNLASHGFAPWTQVTFDLKADSTSDVLSFLALGGPAGVPPFALLDGVSMQSVPEPRLCSSCSASGCLVSAASTCGGVPSSPRSDRHPDFLVTDRRGRAGLVPPAVVSFPPVAFQDRTHASALRTATSGISHRYPPAIPVADDPGRRSSCRWSDSSPPIRKKSCARGSASISATIS